MKSQKHSTKNTILFASILIVIISLFGSCKDDDSTNENPPILSSLEGTK